MEPLQERPHRRRLRLAAAIAKSKAIKEINLANNNIGDTGAAALAAAVAQSKSVKQVNLAGNSEIGGAGWAALMVDGVADAVLPGRLAHYGLKLGDTKWLLSSKSLTDGDCAWLAAALPNCPAVATLDLGNNKLGEQPGIAIGEALKTNKTLTNLYLQYNNLGSAESKIKSAWGSRSGNLSL